MAKRDKVMDIHDGGIHLAVIRINDRKERNPYRVLKVYGAGGYRYQKQIAKYGDLISVICFIKDLYMDGADTMTFAELLDWVEAYHGRAS